MDFFKNLLKGSSCGCKKTHKRNRSGYKHKKSMRGGYTFSLKKNSSDKIVSLSSNSLSKKHSKSNQRNKSNQHNKSKKLSKSMSISK